LEVQVARRHQDWEARQRPETEWHLLQLLQGIAGTEGAWLVMRRVASLRLWRSGVPGLLRLEVGL